MDDDARRWRAHGRRWDRYGPPEDEGWDERPPERGPMARAARGESWTTDEGRIVFRRRGEHYGRGPRGWTRSDARIREEICERMARHGHLDASRLRVEVTDGEVTLEGEVPNRLQKRLAEDIADRVLGVVDVHNRLTLPRSTTRATPA